VYGTVVENVRWRVRFLRVIRHTSDPSTVSEMLARMWSPSRTLTLPIVIAGFGMISHHAE
jgi:hypothetical protein